MDVRDWVGEACKALVDYPEDVVVTLVEGSQNHIIEVTCRPSDFGKMVGFRWGHFKGMRDVLTGVGGRQGKRYLLEGIEPESEPRVFKREHRK